MNTIYPSLSYPTRVDRLVISDFDETYMPYLDSDKWRSGIGDLELFVESNRERLSLLIGWVTGSSLSSVIKKVDGNISRLPHFIAPCLGSELYWVNGNSIEVSEQWEALIRDSGFRPERVEGAIEALRAEGIDMPKQIEDYQGRNQKVYYYYPSDSYLNDIERIKDIASQIGAKALVTMCNPAAGDPENCYDVQFLPKCCGKSEVMHFVMNSYGVAVENTWAFGDSFNDYEVLMAAGNPYLVANADLALKSLFPQSILKHSYCHGIKEALERI